MGRSFLLALVDLVATVGAQDLQISTPPAIYQCQAAAFSYTCPAPPCTVVARPSGDATSIAHSFGDVNDQAGKVSWQPVDQAEGSSVTLWITDKQGNTISSSALSVAAGSDDSCLKGGSASKISDSSDAAGSKTTAAGQTTTTSGGSTAASSSASKASGPASSGSSSTSASKSGDAPASTASLTTDDSGAISGLSKSSLAAGLVGAVALCFLF